MRLAGATVTILCLLTLTAAQQPKGVPLDTYSNYAERTLLVWTNMLRLSPDALLDHFFEPNDGSTQGIFAQYTKTTPVHWNYELNKVARSYADDWASDPACRQSQSPHTSCDGTSFSARVGGAYSGGGGIAENMFPTCAFDARTAAMHSTRAFVCEGTIGSGSGFLRGCVPDGNPADGHRRTLMNGGMKEVGMGWADPGHRTVIQNFGGGAPAYPSSDFIYSGAHLFDVPGREGQLTFWLNIYNTATPTSVAVVIEDDQSYPMEVGEDLGEDNAGTYEFTMPESTTGGCRYYYFLVDGTDRYPAEGAYATYLEAGCEEDWVDKDFDSPDAGTTGGLSSVFSPDGLGGFLIALLVIIAVALIAVGGALYYQRIVLEREDDLDRELHESMGLKWDGGKRAKLADRRKKRSIASRGSRGPKSSKSSKGSKGTQSLMVSQKSGLTRGNYTSNKSTNSRTSTSGGGGRRSGDSKRSRGSKTSKTSRKSKASKRGRASGGSKRGKGSTRKK